VDRHGLHHSCDAAVRSSCRKDSDEAIQVCALRDDEGAVEERCCELVKLVRRTGDDNENALT
jgi:hypothetical protein